MNLVDSCGWLEYFADTKYADRYEKIIQNTGKLLVPTICIAEVSKKIFKEKGEVSALMAIAAMRQGREVNLTTDIAVSAARISVQKGMPMTDSIVYATALKFGAKLFTQDSDFRSLENVVFVEKKSD